MNTLVNLNLKINKNYISLSGASNKQAKSSRIDKLLNKKTKAEILETTISPCGLAEDLLNDYVDCELESSSAERVEEHLNACEHCKKVVNELVFLKASSALLSSSKELIDNGIKSRLRTVLNKELGINLINANVKK